MLKWHTVKKQLPWNTSCQQRHKINKAHLQIQLKAKGRTLWEMLSVAPREGAGRCYSHCSGRGASVRLAAQHMLSTSSPSCPSAWLPGWDLKWGQAPYVPLGTRQPCWKGAGTRQRLCSSWASRHSAQSDPQTPSKAVTVTPDKQKQQVHLLPWEQAAPRACSPPVPSTAISSFPRLVLTWALPTYLSAASLFGCSHHLQRQAYLRLGNSYHQAGGEGPAKLMAVGVNCTPRQMKLRGAKTAVLPRVLAEESSKRTTNVKERYTDPVVLSRAYSPIQLPQKVSTSWGYRAPERRRLQLKSRCWGKL